MTDPHSLVAPLLARLWRSRSQAEIEDATRDLYLTMARRQAQSAFLVAAPGISQADTKTLVDLAMEPIFESINELADAGHSDAFLTELAVQIGRAFRERMDELCRGPRAGGLQ